MDKIKKYYSILISMLIIFALLTLSTTAVYAWFTGIGYTGSTMSYSRRVNIGATSSEITNFHGVQEEGFNYQEIDPEVGFEANNLIPSSYIYLRTDIENISNESTMLINLYLQDIIYDESLYTYLYFGVNNPITTIDTYSERAVYNQENEEYRVSSIPLIERFEIDPGETESVFWYVHIDSAAGLEIAEAQIDLGNTAITYS